MHRDGVIIVLGLQFALPEALRRHFLRALTTTVFSFPVVAATSASCRGTSQQNIAFWMYLQPPTLRRRAPRAVSAAVSFFFSSLQRQRSSSARPSYMDMLFHRHAGGSFTITKAVVQRLMVGPRAPHSSSHCNEQWEGCRVRHGALQDASWSYAGNSIRIFYQSQRVVYQSSFLFFSRLPRLSFILSLLLRQQHAVAPSYIQRIDGGQCVTVAATTLTGVCDHHRDCARCQGHYIVLDGNTELKSTAVSSDKEKTYMLPDGNPHHTRCRVLPLRLRCPAGCQAKGQPHDRPPVKEG